MRNIGLLVVTFIMLVATSTKVFAGEWKQDNVGWWYQNDDGGFPTNAWQQIDGKQYYFDANGYMLANTITPDGKRVNQDGSLALVLSDEYAEYIGDFMYFSQMGLENDLHTGGTEESYLKYTAICSRFFEITKIENGRVYGTYWGGRGMTYDFSTRGLPLEGKTFTIKYMADCYYTGNLQTIPRHSRVEYAWTCTFDSDDGKQFLTKHPINEINGTIDDFHRKVDSSYLVDNLAKKQVMEQPSDIIRVD